MPNPTFPDPTWVFLVLQGEEAAADRDGVRGLEPDLALAGGVAVLPRA